jgi:hypothetical protein
MIEYITEKRRLIKEVGDINLIQPLTNINPILNRNINVKIHINDKLVVLTLKLRRLTKNEYKVFIPDVLKTIPEFYNLEYTINGDQYQFIKSDYSMLIRIMKTIVDFTIGCIKKFDIQGIIIVPADKHGTNEKTDKQKQMLYSAILNHNLPSDFSNRNIDWEDIKYNIIHKTLK